MPRCETCGSIVSKDEIKFDSERDRTICACCDRRGPVNSSKYEVNLRFTEQGFAVYGKAPNGEIAFAESWNNVKQAFDNTKDEKDPPLKLVHGER